jgi:murein DD-endopeptidase MepM/ murein hydrolase activator NlpD
MTKEQKNFICYGFLIALQLVGVIRLISNGSSTAEYDPQEATARITKYGLAERENAVHLMMGVANPDLIKEATELSDWDGTLMWPVEDGLYVRGWRPKDDTDHIGIDTSAPAGTSVLAAADGIVAYAGDALGGYGNIIFVVHKHGFITSYAHNTDFVAHMGQLVRKGQEIAHVGATGKADGPHSHWEFKYGGKVCNAGPLVHEEFLQAGTNAPMKDRPQATWEDPAKRPEGIECVAWRESRKEFGDSIKQAVGSLMNGARNAVNALRRLWHKR